MTSSPSPNLTIEAPSEASLANDYDGLDGAFARASTVDAIVAAVGRWDELRRRLSSWTALVELRFRQDTRDPEARAAREHCDRLRPQLVAREVAIKRRLLADERRPALEAAFGAQAFRLWGQDAQAYAPALDRDLIREAELEADYNSLIAGISVEFDGRRMTFGELRGYANASDRSVRRAAERIRWEALAERGSELDRIYDEMVRLRDRMGKALGHANFIPLAYARMHRIDYDAEAVALWRDAVVRDVVPLAARIVERCAAARGYERAMVWDESALVDAETRPILDGPAIVRELPAVLGDLDPRLGAFGTFMRDHNYLDVFARKGKGPGGFCTSFPSEGYPFIFASFNGTKDDIRILVHEMGHAFQTFASNDLPLEDYLTPTLEAAEIHSMGLEFLAWPALERYFGPRTDLFRSEHLASALLFLPYGCAVDHFNTSCTPIPKPRPTSGARCGSKWNGAIFPGEHMATSPMPPPEMRGSSSCTCTRRRFTTSTTRWPNVARFNFGCWPSATVPEPWRSTSHSALAEDPRRSASSSLRPASSRRSRERPWVRSSPPPSAI